MDPDCLFFVLAHSQLGQSPIFGGLIWRVPIYNGTQVLTDHTGTLSPASGVHMLIVLFQTSICIHCTHKKQQLSDSTQLILVY